MALFGREKRSAQHDALENIVGASANFRGTLRSDGGLRIDGTFEGTIEVAGNVVIGEGARVVADITARNITVGGAVKGNINGTGRLEILSTGHVYGDIAVASVMIDEGGLFQGTSRMRGLEHPALAAPRDGTAAPAADDAVVDIDLDLDDGPLDVEPRPARPSQSLDVDDIEPIIPDVVIEDVDERSRTSSRGRPDHRRGRRGSNGS
jgi:cytoskeletal protein CcmA (bactofilin family)